MSLDYNMTTLAPGEYEAKPDAWKGVFHGPLAWWLMFTACPIITERTIPTILERLQLLGLNSEVTRAAEALGVAKRPEVLQQFIGFRANVSYEPNAKWSRRIFKATVLNDKAITTELRSLM